MKLFFLLLLLVPVALSAQTFITLQPHYADGGNSYIRSNLPETPIVGASDLTAYAWTCDADLCTGRGFFKIGLEEIPDGALINSAYLYLYANTTTGIGFGGSEPQTGNNAGQVYRVIEDWDDATLTWTDQPEITIENAMEIEESTDPIQDYVLDATLMIQDMMDDPASSYGFSIRLDDESDFYSSLIFASSYHFNEDMHPKLIVEYTIQNTIESEQKVALNMFPNPAKNNCTILFEEFTPSNSEIIVYDIFGNTTLKMQIPAGVINYNLPVEKLPEGLYFVNINNALAAKLQIIR